MAALFRENSTKIRVGYAGVILAILLVYMPSLWSGFVYDDRDCVLLNPLVKGPLDLKRIFTESFSPGKTDQGLYRPLITLSYHLDRKLWGFPAPGKWNGFHLTNILLHALNACLFISLLRRLGFSYRLCLLSGLVFGIHPALTEAVAWITGRSELLGASFGLLAILIFLRYPTGGGTVFFFILWILSMLCKETYAVLPGLTGLILWLFPKSIGNASPSVQGPDTTSSSFPLTRKKILLLGICCVVVIVCWRLTSLAFLGNWRPSLVAYQDVSHFSRISTALGALWRYIGLWLWPFSLSVHHDIRLVSHVGIGMGLFATWLFVFWIGWRTRRFAPWLTLAIAWFWISVFLVSNVIVPIGAVFGERFMYLSTLFLAPAVILMMKHVLSIGLKEGQRLPIAIVATFVWCLFLYVGSYLRLQDWRSNITLWESASKRYPHSFVIKAPWAESLLWEGRFAEAHLLAREALDQLQHQPKSYQKIFVPSLARIDANARSGMKQLAWIKRFVAANELARNLHLKEALESYLALIEVFPEQTQTYEALGDLYLRLQNPMGALQNFEKALNLGAKSADLYAKYGSALSELDKKAEALMAYEQALRLNPKNYLIHYQRGVVLGDLEAYSDALDAFRTANKLSPQFAAPHLNAAAILIHLKRYEKAQQEIQQVLALDSKQREAHELLGRIPPSALKSPSASKP